MQKTYDYEMGKSVTQQVENSIVASQRQLQYHYIILHM